jgi:hypothetical protein
LEGWEGDADSFGNDNQKNRQRQGPTATARQKQIPSLRCGMTTNRTSNDKGNDKGKDNGEDKGKRRGQRQGERNRNRNGKRKE